MKKLILTVSISLFVLGPISPIFAFNEQRKFTGHEFDSGTNLLYMGQRYYNPSNAKFISQDPAFKAVGNPDEFFETTGMTQEEYLMNPQAHNPYAYANGNPVRNVDPDGQLSMDTLADHPLRSVDRVVGWRMAAVGLTLANRHVSASLLVHSTRLEPGDLTITEKNQGVYGNPINRIRESKEYDAAFNEAIDFAQTSNEPFVSSLRFADGDLYTSLNRANIEISVLNVDGNWVANTTITDVYDFNETNPSTYKGTMTRIPATQAFQDQADGYLSNYKVNIKFTDTKKANENKKTKTTKI